MARILLKYIVACFNMFHQATDAKIWNFAIASIKSLFMVINVVHNLGRFSCLSSLSW